MQILDKAITPDGIEIELHDLSGEHKLPDYNGMIIVFCTVAKNTFPEGKGWYSQKGKQFRSSIYSWGEYTKDMIKTDYEALKNGTKSFVDLKAHFFFGIIREIVLYLAYRRKCKWQHKNLNYLWGAWEMELLYVIRQYMNMEIIKLLHIFPIMV